MPRNRDRIAELVDQIEPRFREAFLSSIDDLRDNVELGRIVAALERGDIRGAIEAMHLDPAAFDALDRVLAEALRVGGIETIGGLPVIRTLTGSELVMRFDGRNVRAEAWLRQHSSEFITAIVADQREAIRVALEDGMAKGINPRTVALDVVGRMNNATGKREGGVIGITAQQERFVANARAELLSGDRAQLRAYLLRQRRDRRFDPTIIRAIASGDAISRSDADRILQRYKDRLLQLRGETIARTEAMAALHQGQYEALSQVADTGQVQRNQVKRVWRTAGDRRVRDSHRSMHGQKKGLDEQFVAPSGARLRYPGDPQAPAREIINCRCWAEPAIDFLKGIQ